MTETSPQRQLVGALLLSPHQLPSVVGLIDSRDFTDPESATVYAEMVHLHSQGGFKSFMEVAESGGRRKRILDTGWIALMAECRTCSDVMVHVRGVLDQSLRRRLRMAACDLEMLADQPEVSPDEVREVLGDIADWVPEPFNVPSEVVNVADFLAMEDEDDG